MADTWERGDAYERYIGRWSRRVAPAFLAWLDVPAGRRWLDVGCGTGALGSAIVELARPSSVAGVEPSEGFLDAARARLGERVALHRGSATAIPIPDGAVDVVVSGLVLNFVPDARAALGEMARVTGPSGTIAAYVWDYADKMEVIRRFWDAAIELDPSAASLDEARRFPLCRRDALAELFARAGLRDVDVTEIDVDAHFASYDDYWEPFSGGQGPAPSYVASLDDTARARLRDCARSRVDTGASGSFTLTARAWAARGTVSS